MKISKAQKFLNTLFKMAGLDQPKTDSTSRILLEGELMGHRTHGLHLVMPYIEHLQKGSMEKEGEPEVLSETEASELWNGKYLPGPWLVEKAIAKATKLSDKNGTGTVVIQRCSHIGCLAAYMEAASKSGHMVIIACSDPDNKTVAPFGGTTGVYSPNPLALGIPTEGDPIIIDVSMSTTSNGLIHQKNKSGEPLPHPWLLTSKGKETTDASTFFEPEPSTILPLGGMDSGYKGFALGIMIEALTSALGGHGRANEPGRWGASTFVQVINPSVFAGENYFKKEMENLKEKCLQSKAIDPLYPVRIPGQRGLEMKKVQLKEGLQLRKDTLEGLRNLAELFDIAI
ncbi:Ldh family oxidoreductase [Jiulongibacter sp. NS-SX5]|uniref:Ldh family oxidoreductase n=1 Tax=Jiulongibacter sp. NS-SX5 TaxID=3463854 RepID=UPI00405A4555